MSTLTEDRIQQLLRPYLVMKGDRVDVPAVLFAKLATYLDLLVRWNARTNLSAVREPTQIVQRHFGESLFAGLCLRDNVVEKATMLDLGSGAGFPGLPIQLLFPEWKVLLAESQGKKAAFLREAVRALEVQAEVWAGRVEDLPSEQKFGVVTLRAVDRMDAMVQLGRSRVVAGGTLLEMTGEGVQGDAVFRMPERDGSFVKLTRF